MPDGSTKSPVEEDRQKAGPSKTVTAARPSQEGADGGIELQSLSRDAVPGADAADAPQDAAKGEADVVSGDDSLDGRGLWALLLLHASVSWSYRSAEFAFPLYFAQLFTRTLLPTSLYGFITTGAGIVFSNATASLIDTHAHRKVKTAQAFVTAQKLTAACNYALFLVLYSSDQLKAHAENGGTGPTPGGSAYADVWSIFAAITLLGCLLILSNVGTSVTIERDWVTTIADGSPRRLSRLNKYMRRIDLLSNLLSPLFVSALTTADYRLSAAILLAISGVTFIFEMTFLPFVFRRFATTLGRAEDTAKAAVEARAAQKAEEAAANANLPRVPHFIRVRRSFGASLRRLAQDWAEFLRMPIFASSVSISLLYMSTLSFDPSFIAYLKSQTTYSDAFIAGMRALCVLTSLFGTVVEPFLERKIGLVRTGTWSLFSELVPLVLPVAALFTTGNNAPGQQQPPAWNTAILFTGLALSRIGLWSFDLCQLAQVQTALSTHPRRNALMGLQFALQNLFDLGHYSLTLGWNQPQDFKYTAAVSIGAVAFGTVVYMLFYARRARGHLVHLDKIGLERLLSRKHE